MNEHRPGAGCLVTQALGDAFGFLVEGHHPVICDAFVREALASNDPPTRPRGEFVTVAAMAGAMAGARSGLSGLSPRLTAWAARLNDQGSFGLRELAALGDALMR